MVLSLLCTGHVVALVHKKWHKLEPTLKSSQLRNEITILLALAGVVGVPTLLSYGTVLDGSKYYPATDVVGTYYVLHNTEYRINNL